MATRDLVPRADGEGEIGTTEKRWLGGHFKTIYASSIESDGSGTLPDYCLSSYSSWASAITAIGSTSARLLVDADGTVSADSTAPSTLIVKVLPGCVITVDTTKTLTINGKFEAERYQAFSCTGTGKVVFGDGSVLTVFPEWWYSSGSYHTAVQAAADCRAANGVTVEFGTGNYEFTSGIIVQYFNVHLKGQGRSATTITFTPGVGAALFSFIKAGTTGYGEGDVPTSSSSTIIAYNSLKGMQITSGDSFVKTAVRIVAADQFQMEDIKIYPWLGTGSVGLITKGHEFCSFRDLFIDCDRPIVLDVGPTVGGGAIDVDHFNFHNLYIVSTGSYPCITWNAYAFVTDLSFTGAQAWVCGTYGLNQTVTGYTTTGRSGTNQGVLIQNMRTEQGVDADAYNLSFESMDQVQLDNCMLDNTRKGIYYRYGGGAPGLLMNAVSYPSTSLEALNVTATEMRVQWNNCFWQVGCTISVGALNRRFATYATGLDIPTTAIYTAGTNKDTVVNDIWFHTEIFTIPISTTRTVKITTGTGFASLDVSVSGFESTGAANVAGRYLVTGHMSGAAYYTVTEVAKVSAGAGVISSVSEEAGYVYFTIQNASATKTLPCSLLVSGIPYGTYVEIL